MVSEILSEYLEQYQDTPEYARQRSLLGRFEEWLEERDRTLLNFDYPHAVGYIREGCNELKRSTKGQILEAMRRFVGWQLAFKTNPTDKHVQELRLDRIGYVRLPKEEKLLKRDELTIEELEQLLGEAITVDIGDFCSFTIYAYFGLRKGEARKIRQINFKEKSIRVIGGRTFKERILFFSDEITPILRMAHEKGYLKIPDHKLYPRIKYYDGMFEGVKLHPHIFRHTFNTHMRNQLKDDPLLRVIMGHTEKTITDLYDAGLLGEIREAMTTKHYMKGMIDRIGGLRGGFRTAPNYYPNKFG